MSSYVCRAQDASRLREVPDNQEVWVDRDSNASLIVELAELEARQLACTGGLSADPARQGERSAAFFLRDAAELDGGALARACLSNRAQPRSRAPQGAVSEQPLKLAEHAPHFFAARASCASVASGQLSFPGGGRAPAAASLAHVRLPSVATDLLVSLYAAEGDAGEGTLLRVLAGLRVCDWSLFGADEKPA